MNISKVGVVFIVGLALVACGVEGGRGGGGGGGGGGGDDGGGGDGGGGSPCKLEKGDYKMQFATVSGNCGDIPDSTQELGGDDEDDDDNECVGVKNDAGCTYELVCQSLNDDGGRTTFRLEGRVAAGVITGEAEFEVKNADGGFVCAGTYDLTISPR